MSVRATVKVHGRVQGVALRSTVNEMAYEMDIRGTIENCDDGSVLPVCEAQKQDIELLIVKIKNMDAPIHVAGMQVEYSPATGEYKMFRIIMGDAQKELLSAATTGTVYLRHISKDIKTIKKTETTMGQNETLIEYAKDNSKQNKTVLIP